MTIKKSDESKHGKEKRYCTKNTRPFSVTGQRLPHLSERRALFLPASLHCLLLFLGAALLYASKTTANNVCVCV